MGEYQIHNSNILSQVHVTWLKQLTRTMAMGDANCEECSAKPWKYRCPGCNIRTCSLDCVKKHKVRTECTGKRCRTQFVPLSDMDDNLLVSDYSLLQEAVETAESAKRRISAVSRLPFSREQMRLRSEARNRRTNLLFLANGMSKRAANRSYYQIRCKRILWTIELRFHGTSENIIDHAVDEHLKLRDILEKHLSTDLENQVKQCKLKQFCKEPVENLQFFLRKERNKGSNKVYYQLDMNKSLRDLLARKLVIEYPVIHVVLPEHSKEFEVCESFTPQPAEFANRSYDDRHHADGIPFREEEIEETNFPQDSFTNVKCHVVDAIPFKEEEIEEGELVESEFPDGIAAMQEQLSNGKSLDNLSCIEEGVNKKAKFAETNFSTDTIIENKKRDYIDDINSLLLNEDGGHEGREDDDIPFFDILETECQKLSNTIGTDSMASKAGELVEDQYFDNLGIINHESSGAEGVDGIPCSEDAMDKPGKRQSD